MCVQVLPTSLSQPWGCHCSLAAHRRGGDPRRSPAHPFQGAASLKETGMGRKAGASGFRELHVRGGGRVFLTHTQGKFMQALGELTSRCPWLWSCSEGVSSSWAQVGSWGRAFSRSLDWVPRKASPAGSGREPGSILSLFQGWDLVWPSGYPPSSPSGRGPGCSPPQSHWPRAITLPGPLLATVPSG